MSTYTNYTFPLFKALSTDGVMECHPTIRPCTFVLGQCVLKVWCPWQAFSLYFQVPNKQPSYVKFWGRIVPE